MSKRSFLVTIVGEDRPGIVAAVSQALFEGGCNLGQASMIRLGGSFTIMMVVGHPSAAASEVERQLAAPASALGLSVRLAEAREDLDEGGGDVGTGELPDARVRVFGADRPGIVAEATNALAAAGLNILHLESAVGGGSSDRSIFVMTIEGKATRGIDALRAALDQAASEGVDATVEAIETLIG